MEDFHGKLAAVYTCVCVHTSACVCVLSRVQLFETPSAAACQAPLSMEFSRQEYWSGCHFLLQGTFPTQGSCTAGRFFTIFSSVAQSCLTPGLPVHHQLQEFTQTHIHRVSDAIQPSHPLRPLLLLPPIPPSIRVFSKESTLHKKWPKYWSFSFSIIPSKEIPGLI